MVRAYLVRLRRLERSRATVDRHLASIRAFFRWLQLTGQVEEVPADLVSSRGGRERKLPVVLGEEMLETAPGPARPARPPGRRDRALLEMIYGLGLRLSEAVGLNLGDLDLVDGRVKVLGKGGKERLLPLCGCADEALRATSPARLDAGDPRRPAGRPPRPRAGPPPRCSRADPAAASPAGRCSSGSATMRGNLPA